MKKTNIRVLALALALLLCLSLLPLSAMALELDPAILAILNGEAQAGVFGLPGDPHACPNAPDGQHLFIEVEDPAYLDPATGDCEDEDNPFVFYKKCAYCGMSTQALYEETWAEFEALRDTLTAPGYMPTDEEINQIDELGRRLESYVFKRTGHHYESHAGQAATCGADGWTAYDECIYCGDIQGCETVPATGEHSWGEFVTVTGPTCGQAGEKQRVCSVCGAVDSVEIPAEGEHSWGEDGVCTVCGAAKPTEPAAEGETETGDETPAEGETETGDETPAEGETETGDGTPAEGETKTEGETETEGETKTEGESAEVLQANTYKVDFHDNGGAGTMTSQTGIEEGVPTALKPNEYHRNGYKFAGWNTEAAGTGTSYDDGAQVTLTSNIDLYAQWHKEIKVTFHANGGTGTMEPQTFYGEENQALNKNIFKKSEAVFSKWSTDPAGGSSGTSYADEQIVKFKNTQADVDLYAQWTAQFVVKFDANGGSGTMEDQTAAEGKALPLNANTFQPASDSYAFNGWNTKADGSGTPYKDKDTIPKEKAYGTTTLYAQWREVYTIKYDKNDPNATGEMDPQTVETGSSVTLSANKFALDGYCFAGWLGSDGQPYTEKQTFTPTQSLTLYAQWAFPAKISFRANGGTGTMSDQTVPRNTETTLKTNTFKRTGFNFTGWNTKGDGSGDPYDDGAKVTTAQDLVLYAQWERAEITGKLTVTGSSSSTYSYGYVGETLTASLKNDPAFKDSELNFFWYHADDLTTPLNTESSKTYVPQASDFGETLVCIAYYKEDETINVESNAKIIERVALVGDGKIIDPGYPASPYYRLAYIRGVAPGMKVSINGGAAVTVTNADMLNGYYVAQTAGDYVFIGSDGASFSNEIAVSAWYSVGYEVTSGSGTTTLKCDGETIKTITGEVERLTGNIWLVNREAAGIHTITLTMKPPSSYYAHYRVFNGASYGAWNSSGAEVTVALGSGGHIYQPQHVEIVYNKSDSSPKTGDMSHLGAWSALCFLSLAGLGAVVTTQLKRRKSQR